MRNRLQTAWLIGVLLLAGCSSGGDSVTVYTSQDQDYAEPILQRFEQETGIRVRAVYDSEAVKTVGLVNRLIAEKNHPRCDLFWNNEEFRTHQLAARGVLAADVPIESFGVRTRQWVWNPNLLGRAALPSRPWPMCRLTRARSLRFTKDSTQVLGTWTRRSGRQRSSTRPPKRAPEAHQTAPRGSRRAPRRPKMASRRAKTAPRRC